MTGSAYLSWQKYSFILSFYLFPNTSIDSLPPFSFGSIGSDDFNGGADVRFVTLEEKAIFYKVQSRSGGKAKQRVCDGIVQMEARSPVSQILKIRVWIFREREAAELQRDGNGPEELKVEYGQPDLDKVCLCYSFCLSVSLVSSFRVVVVHSKRGWRVTELILHINLILNPSQAIFRSLLPCGWTMYHV